MSNHSGGSFNWKIAGEAGHGVMLAARTMARVAKRHGMQAFNYLEYPSLIRGGHQTGQVYADFTNASCQKRDLDLLIAYTPDCFSLHQDEITSKTVIVSNSDFGAVPAEAQAKWGKQITAMPLSSWAKETTGTTLASNTTSLGVSAFLLGLDPNICKQVLKDEFKNPKITDLNFKAFDLGYQEAGKALKPLMSIKPQADESILVNGNEAIGMGAVAGGLQFYSAYPMTPATGLLHFLNEHKYQVPMVVKQVEDEIGAINEAVGASIAGVRAMTGSSGGGFALMVEALSFAGTAEVPLVILEAQRTGPASGVPTWTAQADLQFILTAGHGDFPRVVLTPGTVQEHFDLSKKAMYLAEKYQLPVLIVSDKYILESHQTMKAPAVKHKNERASMTLDKKLPADESYLRYQDTKDGISPRTIPGQEFGLHLANSYEHDQWGFATEDGPTIARSVEKRARKMQAILTDLPQPYLIGPKKAEVTFVSWGSTVNVLLELLRLAKPGSVNVIHLPCLYPLPTEAFTKLAKTAKKLVMVEGNANGQAENWIRQQTDIKMDDRLRRYDGRPFYAEDLLKYLGQ
ncbi:MAG TPA: 2-oxoacid:acceptor oxidoreductase subunit alpha [Candidatus Woesebacteria bacterium]|nr:2-oxoacid:acceptor oxidoreductase subunit alpha [Candidatus Woesebacteria bacterium]